MITHAAWTFRDVWILERDLMLLLLGDCPRQASIVLVLSIFPAQCLLDVELQYFFTIFGFQQADFFRLRHLPNRLQLRVSKVCAGVVNHHEELTLSSISSCPHALHFPHTRHGRCGFAILHHGFRVSAGRFFQAFLHFWAWRLFRVGTLLRPK